ncbi:hypothetical protein K474DRAFT_359540 [Panus rudis PR-1116 ss-1]|nr:hypothetical protein K474DRAFT_359540 [Panus rudis PR-1116 ss-1]
MSLSSDPALADLGITAQEAATLVSQYRVTTTISYAVLSILIYDTILTFPQEVRCIWKRRWTGATLLYAIIRYSLLLSWIVHELEATKYATQKYGKIMVIY